MSLISRVATAMGEMAPLSLADRSWDNVGVLVESPSSNGNGVIMLTIDLTPEVMAECIRKKAEVILSYHPPIFSSFKRLTLRDTKQRIILQTIREGMSIYAPHTSLDACDGGLNDWLVSLLGKTTKVAPITPMTVESNGKPAPPHIADSVTTGVGRVADLAEPVPMEALVEAIKVGLGIPTARVSLPAGWELDRRVRSVAVCAGSGFSVFRKLERQVDVLFSGEMGHHDVLAANAAGQAVILCEHTNTERGYLAKVLRPRLQEMLGAEVVIEVSEVDRDPLVVW